MGKPLEEIIPNWHRLSLSFDGQEIYGATLDCQKPKNSEEMQKLIALILESYKGQTVPDTEVLGQKSP